MLYESTSITACIYIFADDFGIDSVRFVHRILVVSSFAKLLAIPAVIWAQTHSTVYLLLTRVLVFTSNVAAFKGQYSLMQLQHCVVISKSLLVCFQCRDFFM